jgi:hypothetical protein
MHARIRTDKAIYYRAEIIRETEGDITLKFVGWDGMNRPRIGYDKVKRANILEMWYFVE